MEQIAAVLSPPRLVFYSVLSHFPRPNPISFPDFSQLVAQRGSWVTPSSLSSPLPRQFSSKFKTPNFEYRASQINDFTPIGGSSKPQFDAPVSNRLNPSSEMLSVYF